MYKTQSRITTIQTLWIGLYKRREKTRYSLDKRSNEYLLYLPADLGLFVVLQARAGRCRSEQKYSAVIDLKYSVRYSLQERAQATRFFVSMSAVVLSMISAILSDLANGDSLSICVTQISTMRQEAEL